MAKVRVYELAKELSIDSKELVEKLKAGGVLVKNYMSTLDEDTVTRAREIISGAVSEVIEEKRIRPTVIRRRKKMVALESEKAVARAAEEVPEEEAVAEKAGPVPQVRVGAPAPGRGKARAEPVEEEGEALEGSPRETAARVPSLIEAEVPVDEMKEAVAEEPVEIRPAAREEVKERIKKGKKRRGDQPAKIIKRAEEGPLVRIGKEKVLEATRVAEEVAPVKAAAGPAGTKALPEEKIEKKEKAFGKKKDKKRVEGEEEAGVTPRGIARHRKLEVFERADLYDGRTLRRKKKEIVSKEVRRPRAAEIAIPKLAKRKIKVPEQVTVADLARTMGVKAAELIKKLIALGMMATINQPVDFEAASLLADEFGFELELDHFEVESLLAEKEDKAEDLKARPPVVTIMGHVDHGKTSLLDHIRKSNIIAGESGGITQHIGAYFVEREKGDIVFLDTPGHEAFTAMRARGAKVTDIIVLVVAGDDGVMPQTKEAINHARAASIPMIVGINKIDKPEANVDKVRRELAELGLVPEEWGGETIFANISAKTGQGVDELLELIILQAEILELKANPNKPARGTIIEARLDKNRGPVATVLIKSGTLRQGDHFLCGEHFGRVRAMLNSRGKRMPVVPPSMPVEIYGISGVPMAGDEFVVLTDERKTRQIIEYRTTQSKTKDVTKRGIVSLEDLFEKIKQGEVKELNIILKADVQGSIEAIAESLLKLSTPQVKLKIIHSSTGAITESDVMLASASEAIIIGFSVRANPRVAELAEREKIDIRYYDVIYNAIQDMRLAMAGLLEPVYKESVIGRADIKEVFHIPKVGSVAGCYVTDGHVERNAKVRLLRDEVVIFDGRIGSLRRFKEDVKEVATGYECGIGLENFQDIKPGDVFEIYQLEQVKSEL